MIMICVLSCFFFGFLLFFFSREFQGEMKSISICNRPKTRLILIQKVVQQVVRVVVLAVAVVVQAGVRLDT
jgi:hypothetical protein